MMSQIITAPPGPSRPSWTNSRSTGPGTIKRVRQWPEPSVTRALEGDEEALKGNGEALKGDWKAIICNEEPAKADADA